MQEEIRKNGGIREKKRRGSAVTIKKCCGIMGEGEKVQEEREKEAAALRCKGDDGEDVKE